MAANIYAVSVEYIQGPLTASVPLDTQVVEVAFLPVTQPVPDDTTSWITAAWVGNAGLTRSWEILVGPGTTAVLPAGKYTVFSRVHDTPEVPVRKHDTLTVS